MTEHDVTNYPLSETLPWGDDEREHYFFGEAWDKIFEERKHVWRDELVNASQDNLTEEQAGVLLFYATEELGNMCNPDGDHYDLTGAVA